MDGIERRFNDNGIWTKAYVDVGADPQKQKVIHIELIGVNPILVEDVAIKKAE